MSNNKYVVTNCVPTTQTKNGKIIGTIESIIVKPHRFIIKTNVMTMVVKNEINFFSDIIDREMVIGKPIYSWVYDTTNRGFVNRFVFYAQIDKDCSYPTEFYINVSGSNNFVHYVRKNYSKVQDISVKKHSIIIKTKHEIIKIKNKFDGLYMDYYNRNSIIGCHIIDWERERNDIIFKTKEGKNIYVYVDNDFEFGDVITIHNPTKFVEPSYGTITSIKTHNNIEIKTTKGVFTFIGNLDDDGICSFFCPKIKKCFQREMIGKKIINFEKIYEGMTIYCNDKTSYVIKIPTYYRERDRWCFAEIECKEYFF